MFLAPHEKDKLLLAVAAMVARDRKARGVRLNHPEAVALISNAVVEGARDGRSVPQLMEAGRHVLGVDDVMSGVAALLHEVAVEATFPDGTKLVTVHDPLRAGDAEHDDDAPGAILTASGTITLNDGMDAVELEVVNTGDRPVQVGSHYHFAEANPALRFDRAVARGCRLDIPAGTAVRFEPGINRTVQLVPLAGARVVAGLRGETAGAL